MNTIVVLIFYFQRGPKKINTFFSCLDNGSCKVNHVQSFLSCFLSDCACVRECEGEVGGRIRAE